jgi:hypothetical protein
MTRRAASIEVADYHEEIMNHAQTRPADYHPATANEPRRVLTWNGEILAGSNNGEGRNDWAYQPNVTVHTAVTGSGYAYGASVAACNGNLELSYQAELSGLVKVTTVDARLLCRRPGCRAARSIDTSDRGQRLVRGLDLIAGTYPIPSNESVVGQTPPIEGDQVT